MAESYVKYNPPHREFCVGDDSASQGFFGGSPADTATDIPGRVDTSTIPGLVDGGTDLPSQVDRGLIPPMVDKRGT